MDALVVFLPLFAAFVVQLIEAYMVVAGRICIFSRPCEHPYCPHHKRLTEADRYITV